MRHALFSWWGDISYRRCGTVLAIVLVATALMLIVTPPLKMTTRWVDMLPEHDSLTVEFNNIIDHYASASNIVVVAKGPGDRLRKFADTFAPKVSAMTRDIKRVEFTEETDYFKHHGFMLVKESDLKNQVDMFRDINLLPFLTAINDNFEKEYINDDNSLSSREKEDNAIRFLDGLQYWLTTLDHYVTASTTPPAYFGQDAVDRLMIGDPYYMNNEKNMLVMFIHPTFPVTETDRTIAVVNHIDTLLTTTLTDYPELDAGLTGELTLVRDEMAAMSEDMYLTTIIAMFLILALFIFSFRMWMAPLLAGITLIIGLAWATVFASWAVHTLNLMTSMFAVILIGLGIDYSIHIISLYTEFTSEGMAKPDALRESLVRSGPGIVTGALTTSCAFFMLMISDSRGMSEFGLVAGGGLLACMLASIIVLPAMLAFRERFTKKKQVSTAVNNRVDFRAMAATARAVSRFPRTYILLGAVITIAMVVLAFHLTFDYNYLNMEPKGLRSIVLQDEMIKAFDISPDFVLVTANGVDEARRLADKAKDYKSVGMVTSISEYIPSREQQAKRLPYILKIRKDLQNQPKLEPLTAKNLPDLASQIDRLGMNIMELADMAYLGGQDRVDHRATLIVGKASDTLSPNLIDRVIADVKAAPEKSIARLNSFQKDYRRPMISLAMEMADTAAISLATVPTSIVDKYADSTGSNFLVTIYPDQQVWDFEFLSNFTDQMMHVSKRITGTPPLFLRMMYLVGQEGKEGTMLAVVVVFILLAIDFRSIKYALLAMIPLIVGFTWMLGLLKLSGEQLTFINVMAIPLIVGIGIDDGVHILHRYRADKKRDILTVMRSTGRAVLITSLTTMLAFGSLIFATYRGLGSMGTLLFFGVGACLVATTVLLTAIISWADGVRHKHEKDLKVVNQKHD